MFDFGEYLLLDADNIPPTFHLSPEQTPKLSNYLFLMFDGVSVRLAKIYSCACLKKVHGTRSVGNERGSSRTGTPLLLSRCCLRLALIPDAGVR